MGSILSTILAPLNILLPFTNPNTPLLQDLIHTFVLCSALYFAPQISDLYNKRRHTTDEPPGTAPHDVAQPPPQHEQEEIPLDDRLVLQPDSSDSDEEGEQPPPAPTPPPGVPFEPPPAFDEPGIGIAGPANADHHPRPTPANRAVGAKKAKSLARKDQRRAYHEFHRQQAELRRLEEAEGKEEREAALLAEKQRRADAERAIQAREREERERKKEDERREVEAEWERRERVVRKCREELGSKGAVDLWGLTEGEGKDEVWIERLIRASGILSQAKDGSHVMITEGGWLVRIDAELMQEAYDNAVVFGEKANGKVSFDHLGQILEKAVRARAKG